MIEAMSKETDKKIQKNAEEIRALAQETDIKLQETDKQFKIISRTFGRQENRWGKLVEALVAGDNQLVRLMKKRNIDIIQTAQRVKKRLPTGGMYEIDILLKNGVDVVLVEVKTTLNIEDIKHFEDFQLGRFIEMLPEYSECNVYGAVAFLDSSREATEYAGKKGLFVISVSGQGLVNITNADDFLPKNFNTTKA